MGAARIGDLRASQRAGTELGALPGTPPASGIEILRPDRRRFGAWPHEVPRPPWLDLLDACQRSCRAPVPVAVDVFVVYAAVFATTGSQGAGILASATFAVAGLAFGLYRGRTSVESQGITWHLERAVPALLSVATVETLYLGLRDQEVLGAIAACLCLLVVLHSSLWLLIGRARREGRCLSRALVVGPAGEVEAIRRRMEIFPEAGLACVHSYVPRSRRPAQAAESRALVIRLLSEHRIDHVVCISGDAGRDVYMDFVRFAAGRVDVTIIEPMARIKPSRSRLGDLTVRSIPARRDRACEWWKRGFDVTVASILLVVLSPVLAAVAAAIRLGDPGPAVFRQLRAGRHGRPFTIYKFRSMVCEAGGGRGGFLTRDQVGTFTFKPEKDPRVTRVGTFIRRFSIDELPQLLNVLKGEMSLVGPRPLAFSPDEFDARANVRFMVRPGITGLWQVTGGNALADNDMFELDLGYVMTHTFWVDLFLLLKTAPVLARRRAPY